MGVAVLPPQDCLRNHHYTHRQVVSPANKPRRIPNPNPNPNSNSNSNRSSRRRRNSPPPKAGYQARPGSPPVMGQVRMLKRGEDVSPPRKSEPVLKSDGFFAGSTVTSPPPSSVPLPAFFTARRNCGLSADNQEIESELKRVLRLI